MLQNRPKFMVTVRATPPSFEPGIRPFLRWAGSKRRLLRKIGPYLPEQMGEYFEPFLGSGSLFFSVRPESATLSDLNPGLIGAFKAIRDNVDRVIDLVRDFRPTRVEYYRLRDDDEPSDRWEAAARFVILNRMCWNGLYRENLQGRFNVPYGWGGQAVLDESQLRSAATSLERVKIRCCDFSVALRDVVRGDFVFLDPPYVTSHSDNGFIEYNSRLFKWEDQIRLVQECHRLTKRGARFLMTNGAHPAVDALYKDFSVKRFRRHSTIAGDPSYRKLCYETVIWGGYE
jgi:DNA adenine methylase